MKCDREDTIEFQTMKWTDIIILDQVIGYRPPQAGSFQQKETILKS